MQQGGGDGDDFVFRIDLLHQAKLAEHFPRRLHHTEAVAIAAVIRTGIRQVRHAQLANATEPLELRRVEQSEQERIGWLVQPKGDHVVNGVSDDLFTHAANTLESLQDLAK